MMKLYIVDFWVCPMIYLWSYPQPPSLQCILSFSFSISMHLRFFSLSLFSYPKRVHSQQTVIPWLQPLSVAWTRPPSSHSRTLRPATSITRWRSSSRMRKRRATPAAAPKEGSSATLKQRKSLWNQSWKRRTVLEREVKEFPWIHRRQRRRWPWRRKTGNRRERRRWKRRRRCRRQLHHRSQWKRRVRRTSNLICTF